MSMKTKAIFRSLLILSLLSVSHIDTASAERVKGAKAIWEMILNLGRRAEKKTASEVHALDLPNTDGSGLVRAKEANLNLSYAQWARSEDIFNTKTKGLIQSLRTRDLVKTVGQERATEDIAKALEETGKIGFVVTGGRGVGKTQLIESVEWIYRLRSAKKPDAPSFVLKVDASNPDFKDPEKFLAYVNELKEMSEIKNAESILFFIENTDQLAKQSDASLDRQINLLASVFRVGPKVKVAMKANTETFESLVKKVDIEKLFSRIAINGSTDPLDTSRILKNHLPLMDPENKANMTDDKIRILTEMIHRYLPGENSGANAIEVFDGALARRTAYLTADEMPAANGVILKYRESLQKLQNQLARVQQLNGKHAQELIQELPGRIAHATAQLKAAERSYNFIKDSRIKLQQIRTAASAVKGKDDVKYNELSRQYFNRLRRTFALSERDFANEISRMTDIGIEEILKRSGKMTLKQFADKLDETIYGQERLKAAIMRAAAKIERGYRTNLFEADKALYSVFITGYPGSGKTEALNLLSEFADNYYRIDGAEFMEGHAVAKLIGAPPGYTGFDEGGEMVLELKNKPRTLLHVDEIEKTDKKLIHFFNQVMNPARVKDGKGTVAQTNQAVVGATSNAITVLPKGVDPSNPKQIIEAVQKATNNLFTSEFMNRFDDIIFAEKNPRLVNNQILGKFLKVFNEKQLMQDNFIRADLSNSAREAILDIVEATTQGTARDIKSTLSRNYTDLLSDVIETGQYFDPIKGTIKKLDVNPGDLLELDFDEATGFIIKVIK